MLRDQGRSSSQKQKERGRRRQGAVSVGGMVAMVSSRSVHQGPHLAPHQSLKAKGQRHPDLSPSFPRSEDPACGRTSPPTPPRPAPQKDPQQTSEPPARFPRSYTAGPQRPGGAGAAAHRTQSGWWPRVKAPGLSQGPPALLNFSLMRAVWQQHKICSYPLSQ